ncbi:hypothetical protein Rhopal_002439-T1 [Rhodotorula paludigena]|uniref:Uncharacterized protein n=1 Tax=Rhodotorula paludigena TaxID=86838 RepID=A0AAV5GLB0_9BASI|nr:hypothetical protein Rhopal_002439-T1 [Rhodotorula paludigena]
MSARYALLVEQLEVARDIVLNARQHSREADEHGFDSSALIFDGTLLFAHKILEAEVELAETADGLAEFARTLHRQAQVHHPRQPRPGDVFVRVTRGMLLPGDDRVPLCVVLWCMRRFHVHFKRDSGSVAAAAWPENVVRLRQGYSWATATKSVLPRFLRDRDLPDAALSWQQGLVGMHEVGEGSASAGLHMHDSAARKKMRTEYAEAFQYFASCFETLVASQPHSLGHANHANVYFTRSRMQLCM